MIINAGEKTADCNRPRTEHLPARCRAHRQREVRGSAGAGDENSVEKQRARVAGTHSMKALIVMRLVRQKKVLAGYETPDPAFDWAKLAGKQVLADHGGQPLAMFKYACHRRGLEYSKIVALDVPSGQMDGAFRGGQGDYIHQQGPAPQQLEHDRVGHVVASVGEAIGPVAFSSLAATRAWLGTDMAKRFMRAYRKARTWLLETPAAKVAEAEAAFFPDIDRAVLTSTIAYYQKLGCWTPHVEITRPAFEVALDVFQHAGLITKRHRYEDVVAAPPAA